MRTSLPYLKPGLNVIPHHMFINSVRVIIESHLANEEYSVEDLSRDMGMSRMNLHRKVKAVTGIPTGSYIRTVRLEHAMRLLNEGTYNVSEVAYLVGFSSLSYFSTCFSAQYGYPPSVVRVRDGLLCGVRDRLLPFSSSHP
jgi:AraC-like DNA-binding protein